MCSLQFICSLKIIIFRISKMIYRLIFKPTLLKFGFRINLLKLQIFTNYFVVINHIKNACIILLLIEVDIFSFFRSSMVKKSSPRQVKLVHLKFMLNLYIVWHTFIISSVIYYFINMFIFFIISYIYLPTILIQLYSSINCCFLFCLQHII